MSSGDASHPTQECISCNRSFDALMYSCPHCGAGGSSVMDGGMEMFDIMTRRQEATRLNDEGARLYQQGKVREAIARLEKSIEVNPMHEKAYENLAFVLMKQGRFNEAKIALEKVLGFNPHREDARRYMTEVSNTLTQGKGFWSKLLGR